MKLILKEQKSLKMLNFKAFKYLNTLPKIEDLSD